MNKQFPKRQEQTNFSRAERTIVLISDLCRSCRIILQTPKYLSFLLAAHCKHLLSPLLAWNVDGLEIQAESFVSSLKVTERD